MPKYLNHHVYKKDLCLYIVYVMTWKMISPSIRYFKPFLNFQDLWKERLRHKFQNSRKRQDKNLPEVKANKRLKTKTTPKIFQGQSVWGMTNYMPEKPESKDEISVQKHIEWHQKEYKLKEGKEKLLVDTEENL